VQRNPIEPNKHQLGAEFAAPGDDAFRVRVADRGTKGIGVGNVRTVLEATPASIGRFRIAA
jgi:hypothetical protein